MILFVKIVGQQVTDPPRIVNFPTKDLLAPEDVKFSRQNALKLPCDAVGSNLQRTWKHNGTAITTGVKFTVGAGGTLYGSYLESAQSGNYQCFVRDTVTGIETFSRKIQVAVTGKESFQYHWYKQLNRSKQEKKTIKPKAVLLMQSLKKKNEFQLVLWARSPHIWLVQSHFLFYGLKV